jgi:hypothetical protein
MALSHLSALRPLRARDLDPLLSELNAISQQAEDIQHRIAVLQAGGPLLRPGWPMRRAAPPMAEDLPETVEEEVWELEDQAWDEPGTVGPGVPSQAEPEGVVKATEPAEDPLALILRIAEDPQDTAGRQDPPSPAELQIRAIRDRIARNAALSAAYLPEARASI